MMDRHATEISDALKANGGNLATQAAAVIDSLMAKIAERSQSTHNHQFAEVNDMWQTLPESLSNAPYAQSPDALRKHALIATGYCDVATIDAGTKSAAARVAASISPLAMRAHGYAIVKAQGPIVRVYTPLSQSYRAMGKEQFQESKTAVLNWIGAKLEAGR